VIEIEHVSKSFGKVAALRDVSLRIDRGQRVAFVGSNGSGKTTLLRALLGLLRVRGRITVAGFDVARDPQRALAHVAYVPQISPPLDAPARELVRAYAALRGIGEGRVHAHAAALGLDLRAVAGTRFRDLSGGMKQKLLAALALSTDAEVLVCDEPTANLDATARTAFFELLEERSPRQIVVLCSHRQHEVQSFVDRVIELRDGQVLRDERPADAVRPLLRVVP
jgi:ABC-type multidrug transport system ATPase subunit